MPVNTAQARARHAWPSARAAGEVIHWQANPGCATDHAAEEADIELARLGRTRADFYLNARSAQPRKALAGNQRIGVCNRRHHLGNARRRQRIAARPRAPLVGAGLKRDISDGATHILSGRRSVAQRHHFITHRIAYPCCLVT